MVEGLSPAAAAGTGGQNEGKDAGLLNNSSSLAAALGVTKFIAIIVMNLVALCRAS